MTTDIENELRELFRDKAGDAPVVAPNVGTTPPREVLRRGRIHQIGTVVGSAAIAFAIVAGSAAGLSSLLRGGDTAGNPGDYEVFERTATIEAFTVTSPSDWYLVNHWPASMDLDSNPCLPGSSTGDVPAECPGDSIPMFQLSNIDLGLHANACRDLPADTAALYVASYDVVQPERWSLEPYSPALRGPSNGTCGPGLYSHFTVNGYPMFAWAGVGPEVSAEDREIVETAYETMSAIDDWEPGPLEHTTPAYVFAGGTSLEGEPWRLELRPSTEDVELSLEGSNSSEVEGISSTVPDVPIQFCCPVMDGTDTPRFVEATFGFVTKDATGVELQVRDADDEPTGQVLEGTIVPLPPTMPFDFDLFFIDGAAGLSGTVIALGLEETPPPVAEPRANAIELSGAGLGQEWTARFTGSFHDDSACIQVTVGIERFYPHCPPTRVSFATERPSMSGWVTPNLYLEAGTVPLQVESVDFVSDTFEAPLLSATCEMGPRRWTDPDRKVCVIAFAPEGSGSIRYLDRHGNVLFVDTMAWDADAASATAPSRSYPVTNEDGFTTARGSFEGLDWKLQVLYYLEGYRLQIAGRGGLEGTLRLDEPLVFPGARLTLWPDHAIALVLTDLDVESVAIAKDVPTDAEVELIPGRWVPGTTVDGDKARLWVMELPGHGVGTLLLDDIGGPQVCWPIVCGSS